MGKHSGSEQSTNTSHVAKHGKGAVSVGFLKGRLLTERITKTAKPKGK